MHAAGDDSQMSGSDRLIDCAQGSATPIDVAVDAAYE